MRQLSFLQVLTLEDSRFVSGVSTISTLPPRWHDVSCHSYEAWNTKHTPVCPCFCQRTLSSRVESVSRLLQWRKLGFSLSDCFECPDATEVRAQGCRAAWK